MLSNVTVFCFMASYLVALGLELARFLRKKSGYLRPLIFLFSLAGLVAQTAYLFNRARETQLPPLLSSTHDWLVVFAWLLVAIFLFINLIDEELSIGLFLFPLVLSLVVSSYFVDDVTNTLVQPAIRSWALLHASLLVLGGVGIALCFVISAMYLIQHRRLKQKQNFSEGFNLPSLAKLARLNRWALMISTPLLTIGMGIGIGLGVYVRKGAQAISFLDPVIIVYEIVWAAMMISVIFILRKKQPNQKHIAQLTIWTGGLLLLTVIGIQILTNVRILNFDSWHSYYSSPSGDVPGSTAERIVS
ncbi:cytochrome C assembly family protein [Gimesia fumaroli]|uniref:Cytochrome C assembly protein n=1 Tax=Gimesia fumaroli TaxID=2527976 RepID=A0A518IAW6_9PLAN|nr:cytochrome c biogenesis protein CcsA [Gimesia fumaroli]QDV50179.1 Cytochrome C assembly protein [Gimesia fumaroli]